ncbi:MAG: hypothetical protein WC442_05990 [Candidatus Omnitrophota bacterium]
MIIKVKEIKGQSFIEYAMLMLVVAAALMAMTVYIQRAMYNYMGG